MENSYHKYRFDIRLKRDSYNFSFFLYDEACENLAFVLSSFYQLLTSVGLGKDKKCFENFKMYVNNTLVYDNGNFQLQDISPNEYI